MASIKFIPCSLLALVVLFSAADGQLRPDFYAATCTNLASIVRGAMVTAVSAERRMGASVLRLHFHDCFVQGCDGSVLLNDLPPFVGEKSAASNLNSLRGFDVIDGIKASVEAACPGVVSCADILALAARDGTVLLGGPTWAVPLGRRDSTNASFNLASVDLPAPSANVSDLIAAFGRKGFTPREMAALSGAHTVGFAQCRSFRERLYKDGSVDPVFADKLKANCPASGPAGDSFLEPLDVLTASVFDNNYYHNLAVRRGLLHSDQEMYSGTGTEYLAGVVNQYRGSSTLFFAEFAAAMVKMGSIDPLTGAAGQVRAKCRFVIH
uniref:Peroxidase n=1 Tax=Hordeum vulgare subsp. vulgare TaxID=112509 RepID=F2EB11_HORVV|nr:predicted protein [Hordeum vulgare subsp. vulgare]